MFDLRILIAAITLGFPSVWFASPVMSQSQQAPQRPVATQKPVATQNSSRKTVPANRAGTPAKQTQAPANQTQATAAAALPTPEFDVFDLDVVKPLTVVEVEPVGYEVIAEQVVPGEQFSPSDVPIGEEFVVGGGGVPTGVRLDNGRWVEDGDVFNADELASTDEYDSSLHDGDYGQSFHGENFQAEHLRPKGARVSPFWARADYLAWSLDGTRVPALVTTSPVGTTQANAGVLGVSGTSVLMGDESIGNDVRSGGRVEFGGWLVSRNLGWHIGYFGLDDSNDRFQFDSNGSSILARPFFSVNSTATGENASLIAFPGQADGNVGIASTTSLDGVELMFHRMLASDRSKQLQLVGGLQYNTLNDDITITDFRRASVASTGVAIGTTVSQRDQFQADNRFSGAALGILGSSHRGPMTIDFGMQMALGNNHSQVRVHGSTTTSVPVTSLASEVVTTPGGLLAQRTNIGDFEQDAFAVLPQLHADLGFYVTPELRLMLGYRFLYWSQIARAGEQMDTHLNLSQNNTTGLRGEVRPTVDFKFTDFWAQGINVGLDYRF